METDPPADGHADAGDFPAGNPNAASARPARFGFDTEASESRTDRSLKHIDPAMQVTTDAVNTDNRVGDKLARAVVGDVATALSLGDVYLGRQDAAQAVSLAARARPAHGDHRSVLEQEQHTGAATGDVGHHASLESVSGAVRDAAEPATEKGISALTSAVNGLAHKPRA